MSSGQLARILAGTVALTGAADAGQLPVPCLGGNCGATGPTSWVGSGAATATRVGSTLTVKQTTSSAQLNWASFNIDRDGKVVFAQPASTSVTLNRIYQDSPSQIFGQIQANGQIYLVNPNGLVFGPTSVVNAAGILASTLDISADVFSKGILTPIQSDKPALDANGRVYVTDSSGNVVTGPDGQPIPVKLAVQAGAQMSTTGANGRILLASQNVENAGTLSAPDGQIILAAGSQVFLQASSDATLRGLLVEVDAGGTAWNALTGALQAPRGDITMVGLAVNQDGRVSASTTVSENGSIHLLARDTVTFSGTTTITPVAHRGGSLELGAQSITQVLPEYQDTATSVDDQPQTQSSIAMSGQQIVMHGGSQVVAPGGNLTVAAASDPTQLAVTDPAARLRVDSGTTIDLSGSDATVPVSANVVDVQLRGAEFSSSPDQRDGALRGKTVAVDARVGTPLADVSGAIAAIPKNIGQRTSAGGTASFASTGDIVVAAGATLNVSGGQTNYQGGMVNTSELITAGGKVVDIGSADPAVTYIGVVNPTVTETHDRWGVIQQVQAPVAAHYEAGYVVGASAGTVQLQAPTLLLAGTFLGHVVNGPYQRTPSTLVAGGQLIIGTAQGASTSDYRAPPIVMSSTEPLFAVADDASVLTGIPLILSTDFLSNGFTRASLYSNTSISLPASVPLTLTPGSALLMHANTVSIGSSITDLAGHLDFASIDTVASGASRPSLSVAPGVVLDVRGTWVNDSVFTNTGSNSLPTQPLLTAGGSILLAANALNAQLSVGEGVGLLASGGAAASSAGKLSGGRGGTISLVSSGQNPGFDLGANVSIEGFGVQGAQGGSFSLGASSLQISQGAQWAGTAAQVADSTQPGTLGPLQLGSGLFSNYGFAQVTLRSTGGTLASQGDAISVTSGTTISATAATLQLDAQALLRPPGGVVAGFTHPVMLPAYQRNPETIAFQVTPYNGYTASARIGSLDIQSGATITADPGSQISLSSAGGDIKIGGSLLLPAGSINALLSPPALSYDSGFDPGLGIYVGSAAVLDVSGTAIYQPDTNGILRGSVLDGGQIGLTVHRGSVVLQKGSRLDVSGSSGMLDVPTGSPGHPYALERVASNAGSISLTGVDSIELDGQLTGMPGIGDTGKASGGRLGLALTAPDTTGLTDPTLLATFPQTPRIIELVPGTRPASVASGLAVLSTTQVTSGGFDALSLQAIDASDAVMLDPGLSLTLGREFEVNAPAIRMASSGAASISAPYVLLGNSAGTETIAAPSSGGGSLSVSAELIELTGSTAWQGIGVAKLTSSGDIRLQSNNLSSGIFGDLNVAGSLMLVASRVYGTTGSQYAINDPAYDVTVAQTPSSVQTTPSAQTPLTAASAVKISATDISQNGTLWAPFGTIELDAADRLSLGAGSLTSVSAAGALLPYGQTQANGAQWIVNSGSGPVTVNTIPTRQVTLNGDKVTVNSGATVNLGGGGDLYAYEWVKGTGGLTDALGSLSWYAILPSAGSTFAPVDAQYGAGAVPAGSSIYLAGTNGLPAGYYALLPARYALLPGAFLVQATPVAGYADIQPGTPAALADGTPIVAGYRTFSDTGLGGTRYSGFAVYPGSFGRALAQYDDHFASAYFKNSGGAQTADAGALALSAGTQLALSGSVSSAAAAGGRGASIDLSATNLTVVGPGDTAAAGGVQVSADVLNSWGASSLLLGGIGSITPSSLPAGSTSALPTANVTVVANQVSVAPHAHLTADELSIVANNTIDIAGSISSTSATSATAPTTTSTALTLTAANGTPADSAAFVSVSDFVSAAPSRTAAPAGTSAGQVTIDTGAQVLTRGALVVDAPGGSVINGSLGGAGASWSLGGAQLTFGQSQQPGVVTITPSVLAQLQSASALRLSSSGGISVNSPVSIGSTTQPLRNITISAASLNDDAAGDPVSFNAQSIVIDGTADPTSLTAPAAGTGTLSFSSAGLEIGGRGLSIQGFAQTSLGSSGQLTLGATGTLVAAGDLTVSAARINPAASSSGVLSATGDVHLVGPTTAASGALPALQLGGALRISGANVDDNTVIDAPSGQVQIQAANALSLGSAAVVDVAGTAVTAASRTVNSNGGVIQLQAGGALSTAAASKLSVAASDGASAGLIDINAGGAADAAGSLDGSSSGQMSGGGSFALSAGSLSNFAALDSELQSSGFTNLQSVHVAQGDLTLAAGATMTAHEVQLISDAGSVGIQGAVSAPTAGARGSIRLYGGAGVTLGPTAQLHADGDLTSGRGGTIELGTGQGGTLALAPGSVVTTGGAQSGQLLLRAPAANGNDIAVSSLGANLTQAGTVTLDAVLQPYAVSGAVTDYSGFTADAANYLAAATSSIQGRLNPTGSLSLNIEPEIELRSSGDLSLADADLSAWHVNGVPVNLTVRASGSVTINGVISDGFAVSSFGAAPVVTPLPGLSAAIRITAGSDLGSVDPTATVRGAAADLTIGGTVRTGTGDLTLAAARDVTFSQAGATVYTGGAVAAPTTTGTAPISFLDQGGRLTITAGRDVVGATQVQSVTAWQGRIASSTTPTEWGNALGQFAWNVGSLGGGDLSVWAGRDINQLSAAAADSAVGNSDGTSTSHYGGGAFSIQALNNINSGMFDVARGRGLISAGGAIASSGAWNASGTPLGILVAMGDANVEIDARTGVSLADVVNPTILKPALSSLRSSYFFTYGAHSSLSVESASGDVDFSVLGKAAISAFFNAPGAPSVTSGSDIAAMGTIPPVVSVAALQGDLVVGGAPYMYPSASGSLQLFAARDVRAATSAGVTFLMSDAAADALPTPLAPQSTSGVPQLVTAAAGAIHLNDPNPITLDAGRDVSNFSLYLPNTVRVSAGRDVVDTSITAQNLRAGDISEISAGRDVIFTAAAGEAGGIAIGGPGRLDVLAGRNVDLGIVNGGITTTGALNNGNIPSSQGANITVLAGAAPGVDYAGFINDDIAKTSSGAADLIAFADSTSGRSDLNLADALKAFNLLTPDLQRPFALKKFFAQLVQAGRDANSHPGSAFKQGYAAIDALFPSSRSSSNPYMGDISLVFSRIYTLAGGNIYLLAPGGSQDSSVNVGLANPPASIQSRSASSLGIVAQQAGNVDIFAQGSVLVNASRIFTLLGGDVAVWSTLGNIDAGRGAKSSLSAPPPIVTVDSSGNVSLDFTGAVAGSGIRTIATDPSVAPGNVDLIAPNGFVNAGDAGIGAAGNLNIAAQKVLGVDNIQVGGSAVGVPPPTSGLAASLSGVSAVGSSATSAAANAVAEGTEKKESTAPIAQSAMSWLDVFVTGVGEEDCKLEDQECLKRQKPPTH